MKNSKFPFILFSAGFFIQLVFFWPGILVSDSIGQYAMAQSGLFTNHHPPFMSFIWRYLDFLYAGPGLMLALHLLLLHGAAFVFYQAFKEKSKSFSFIILPWVPGVIVYGIFILKDISFAYSFMLVAALLTKAHMQDKKLSALENLVFFSALFYGTSVKFQAQYLSPLFLGWYVWQQFLSYKSCSFIKKSTAFLVILALFYTSLNLVNTALVPPQRDDHSWQFVKLFDLTALSLKNNKSYIPKANQGPSYSFENMKRTFLGNAQVYYIDDLVFSFSPVLIKGTTEDDRQILWNQWAKTVTSHPVDYIIHRLRTLAPVIGGTPQFDLVEKALNTSLIPGTTSYKISYYIARLVSFLLVAALPTFLLGFFYLFISIRSLRETKEAFPLLMILLVAYGMPAILFSFSMAGTARYIIVSLCLIHSTHYMAWQCYKRKEAPHPKVKAFNR